MKKNVKIVRPILIIFLIILIILGSLFIIGGATYLGLFLILFLAPLFISSHIGEKKGRKTAGILLGLFLSWIGLIIIVCLSNRNETLAKEFKMQTAMDRQNELLAQIAANKSSTQVPPPPNSGSVNQIFERHYQIAQSGEVIGDYEVAEIQDMIARGQISKNDHYLDTRYNEWRTLDALL